MAEASKRQDPELSLRFFTAAQVDEILRQGMKLGPEGTRGAIKRILKLEPEVGRVHLWHRIRELKNPRRPGVRVRAIWTPEDEEILRNGYRQNPAGKRLAVRKLLQLHPGWGPHLVWQHAAKLGLTQRAPRKGEEQTGKKWSENDRQLLLSLAGYKHVTVIARLLHRSENSVRGRLLELGKSTRFQREGYAQKAIAQQLHFGSERIRRLIARGLLQIRDPRITKASLRKLRKLNLLRAQVVQKNAVPPYTVVGIEEGASRSVSESTLGPATSAKALTRADRVWQQAATELGISLATVQENVVSGVIKLYDPRITEASLRYFCRNYGWMINFRALSPETRFWLTSSMDFVHKRQPTTEFDSCRKHAQVKRKCRCGRVICGNAYFRHRQACEPNIVQQNVIPPPSRQSSTPQQTISHCV